MVVQAASTQQASGLFDRESLCGCSVCFYSTSIPGLSLSLDVAVHAASTQHANLVRSLVAAC
jgi:hypothetical protein